jgi:hypothetical protein
MTSCGGNVSAGETFHICSLEVIVVIGYGQLVLLVILTLIISSASYQALFGTRRRAEAAERVLRIALAPALLGALLGLPDGQEIIESLTAFVSLVVEVIETAYAN